MVIAVAYLVSSRFKEPSFHIEAAEDVGAITKGKKRSPMTPGPSIPAEVLEENLFRGSF